MQTLLAFATVLVVWLVVSPASAHTRAPLCDPRGLIAFAPPPQIQDAEVSLDIPADCVEDSPLETKNYVPGRHVAAFEISSQEPAALAEPVLPAIPLSERLAVRRDVEVRLPPGVRTSVDRPPRG